VKVTPAIESLRRFFNATLIFLGVSLFVPPDNLTQPWILIYPSGQYLLCAAAMILAAAVGPDSGKGRRQLIESMPVHLVLCAVAAVTVQAAYSAWAMVPLVFLVFFPFSIFARHRDLFWVPAVALSAVAAGRFLFASDPGLIIWSLILLFFSGVLGRKMARDWKKMIGWEAQLQGQLQRLTSDAREMMKRIRRDGFSASEDRLRDEDAAMTVAIEEDEVLQKLLLWGCRYFNARTGILLVPGDPGIFRLRAAVHRGVRIVKDLVPADKGFIHIAQERGGAVCLSDARTAVRSLGFYDESTEVGSFLVKVVYDPDWAQDTGDGLESRRIRCILYFDSARAGFFSLDDVTRKRLEEFGGLVRKAMDMSRILQDLMADMSAKYAIARYARNLTQYLDPEKIMEKALLAVREALPLCDGAVVMLADEGLSVVRFEGQAVKDLAFHRILRDEPSQVGLLLRRFAETETGNSTDGGYRAEIVINHEKSRPSPFFYRGEKLGRVVSFTAIPSFMPDDKGRLKLKAVIAAVSCQEDAFKPQDVDDLRTLAGMMAPALDNAQQHRRVDELSRTDGLTGLLNHRTFQLVLDGKINRVNRGYDPSLAVVIVDGDHFKKVNDTYGHPVGDEVLVELARRLKADVRSGDAVARYGGEEFAIALDNVDEKTARQITEKMRRAIASEQFQTNAGPVDLTASFGFSVIQGKGGDSREELLEKADRALYHAKESGRNCVVGYCDLVQNKSVSMKTDQVKTRPMNQEEWQW
jgi:diguanylate cyclase (GGDEF)-like protein